MNEKFCSKCGTKNPAEMIFCLNCGNNLPASAPNFTGDSAPTVFAGAKVTQPTGFQPLPQMPPAPKKSNAGFYLAVFGGLGVILLLVVGGIIGLIAINWDQIVSDDNPPPPSNANTVNSSQNLFNSNIAANRANSNALNNSRTDLSQNPNKNNSTKPPKATFNRVWVDYNITEDGQQGMRIHTNFSVTNMKEVDSYLAIYFQMRDGTPLKDINRKFASSDGLVAAYLPLKPGFDVTDYKDAVIFMPYEELDLDQGKYDLRMRVALIYNPSGLIQDLTFYNFEYTEPVKR